MSLNIQTFSGKVQVNDNLKVGQGHLFVDTAQNKVGLNTSTPVANLHVFGNTFVHNDLRVGSGIVMDQKVATFGTTKTFVVQVVGGVFEIDGVSRPALTFHESQTYIFDQSHNSNGGHPIAFSEAVNGGTPYTTGVTSTGTPGQAGAQTIFKVPVGAPSTLYYYCTQHPTTMGSLSSAPSVVRTDAEIIVSGRLLASSFHGDGANLNNIPASAINGTLSQWVTTGNDIYYSTGGVAIGSSQAPTSTLDVTGSGAFSTTLSVGGDLTVGTDKLFVDVSTGQVGVGTTTPAAGKALDVVGDFQATYLYGDGSNISNITSSQWVTTGTDIYYNTGSVAIGSSQAPTSTLDVTGTGAFSDDVTVGTSKLVVDVSASRVGVNKAAPGYTLDVDGDINFTGNLTQNGSAYGGSGGGGSGGGGVWTEITGTTTDIHYSSGNVGVANSSPQHTLSVGSNLYVEDTGSNVLVVDGNVACTQLTLGQFEIVPSYGLDDVTAESNVTTDTVELNNATTGLSTVANVVVGGELTVSGNAAVSSNLTVTGNATVSSNLTVTGNATVSSNLVTTGNVQVGKELHMQYTDNVAKIQANSNVVTEFSRSKKLIKYPRVALTSAAETGSGYQGYFVESSSNYNADYTHYKAFNAKYGYSTSTDIWYCLDYPIPEVYSGTDYAFNPNHGGTATPDLFTGAVQGEWLKIQLPDKIALDHYILTGTSAENEFPRDWTVYGSVDGTNWNWIDSQVSQIFGTGTGGGGTATGKIKTFQLDILTNEYFYFAFVFTRGSVNRTQYIGVGEIELYGIPEYDPEAHGTDVVVKSVPNVPNTDWLEVYFDAKGLPNGAVTNPISGLGGTTNNGTAAGGLTVSDGVFTFDGTNDSISTTSTATLSFHTASMWIKFEQFSSWAAVYAIRPASLDRNNAFLYANGTDNTFRLEALGNTGPYKDFNYTFEPGKWVHLTVLFDGTGLRDSKLYIDGIELGPNGTVRSDTDDITITGTTTVYMGSEPGYYFTGSFANFRLFNRKLTIDEIYQLYAYQKEEFGHSDLSMTLKAGRLGIGTSEPRAALDVRGNVDVDGVPVLGRPAFYAEMSNTSSGYEGPGIAVFNDVLYNRGSCYSASTGLFTAPITSVYKFHCYGYARGNGQNWWVRPYLNGAYWARGPYSPYAGAGEWIIPMNAGDTLGMYMPNSSYGFYIGGDRHNGFSGYLIG